MFALAGSTKPKTPVGDNGYGYQLSLLRPLNEIILVNKEQGDHNLHKFSCTHIKIADRLSRGNINENKTETNNICKLWCQLKKPKKQ